MGGRDLVNKRWFGRWSSCLTPCSAIFLRESIEIFYFLECTNENEFTFFSVENLFTIAALMSFKYHGNKYIQEYTHYSFSSSNYILKFPVTMCWKICTCCPSPSNLRVKSNQVNTEQNLLISHFSIFLHIFFSIIILSKQAQWCLKKSLTYVFQIQRRVSCGIIPDIKTNSSGFI